MSTTPRTSNPAPSTPAWVDFQTLPPSAIPVAYMEPLPQGCLTADRLHSLAKMLNKLESWARRQGLKTSSPPCLRLVQGSRDNRITALVEVGDTMLKLRMKGEDWIVLGDALKVSD